MEQSDCTKEKAMATINKFDGSFRYLSNFWLCKIVYEDILYPSTEHAYAAAKTLDLNERWIMSKLATPSQVKRYGRGLKLREDWEKVKLQVMYDLVKLKFSQDNELKNKLIRTNGIELIEGNTWGDTYWGVCKGKGENNLGKILMRVRDEISRGI